MQFIPVRSVTPEKVQKTVEQICHEHRNLDTGLKILNVGFGLGMVCV